jgi:hypothetical protein
MTKTQLMLPPVGTRIALDVGQDCGRSADGVTWMVRVTFDEEQQQWVIASRLRADMRWHPVKEGYRSGLMVFLNDTPCAQDQAVVVSAIKRHGQAVYADLAGA